MTNWTVAPRGAGWDAPPVARRRLPAGALREQRYAPRIRDGRPELVEAMTADGMWSFRRGDDAGTTWDIMCVPTRQILGAECGTVADAYEYATAPGLLARLRHTTGRWLTSGAGTAAERDEAARALPVLDALIAGAPALVLVPDTVCGCGGLLAETAPGVYEHLGLCRPGCYDPAAGLAGVDLPCLTPDRHRACGDPAPAECVHHGDTGCYGPGTGALVVVRDGGGQESSYRRGAIAGRPDVDGRCERGDDGRCCGCCRPPELL